MVAVVGILPPSTLWPTEKRRPKPPKYARRFARTVVTFRQATNAMAPSWLHEPQPARSSVRWQQLDARAPYPADQRLADIALSELVGAELLVVDAQHLAQHHRIDGQRDC
jgi:hypothetical protein